MQPVGRLDLPHDVPLFTDACASMGRLPLPSGWAAAAGSAHKWGGPAGVGVLLVRTRARWRNPFPGDDRVDERSTGFENIPAVLAAAAALQAVVAEREEVNARHHELVDVVRRRVAAEVPDVEVVGDPVRRLPHLVTFSCLYVDGEALVTELDRRGFGIASGSACTASTLTPSHVLEAMGVLTHGNVRLSLQRDATRADVDAFCDVLPERRRRDPVAGRPVTPSTSRGRARARLPRPRLPDAGHRARPAPRRRRGRRAARGGRHGRRPPRSTYRPGAG